MFLIGKGPMGYGFKPTYFGCMMTLFVNPPFPLRTMNRSGLRQHIVQIMGNGCRRAAMMQKAWQPPRFRLATGEGSD